jgi:hypothetical protein
MQSKALIHIHENEDGQVRVSCELDPELTDAQRAGEEDLLFPQYVAGVLIEAIGPALERMGLERLTPEPDLQ